jgi:hypothetical protein
LVNIASNAASRQNNVPFHGGNSQYDLNGEVAKQTLEAKNWTFTDGGLINTWNLGIQTTSPNQTFGIQLNGTNPNISVNWGNGTTQSFNTVGNKTITYSSTGNYTVRLLGNFSSNGNIRINNGQNRLKSTSVIPNIPGLTSFESSFQSCSSLTGVLSGIFGNNTAINNFSNCFSSCGLTTIPSTLFANNTAATNFSSCFSSCTGVTTVPSVLFANNTAVNTFGSCFFGVTLTTTSYSDLLINMASNAASRLNNVPFGGGNSQYNLDGQTARDILTGKNWIFTDSGLE